MGRYLLLSALFLFLFVSVGAASATTQYNVEVENSSATMNVSFELYSGEGGTNTWTTTWTLPEGAEVVSLSDSRGPITDYRREGSNLVFETNPGPRRPREVVYLKLRLDDVIREEYGDLKLIQLNLPGFSDRQEGVPDEVTQARITTDTRLLSESHSWGTNYSIGNYSARYKGEGGLSIYLSMSDGGTEYDNYVVFGDGNVSDADELYSIIPSVTGYGIDVNKHPVVVLPDGEYDEKLSPWSEGRYMTGGLIFVRESAFDDGATDVLLHETTHAYNEKALAWGPGVGWFNEGVAKYIEFLSSNELGVRQPEIFGEAISWKKECTRNGRRGICTYVLEPRGQPDDLWNYYQDGTDYMVSWSPSGRNEGFGYAFSELQIRNYVRQNGASSLHPVYNELRERQETIDDPQRASTIVLEAMGTDLTPCNRESRQSFRMCLESVNSMDPEIPGSPDFDVNGSDEIGFREITEPEVKKEEGLISRLQGFLRGLIRGLGI